MGFLAAAAGAVAGFFSSVGVSAAISGILGKAIVGAAVGGLSSAVMGGSIGKGMLFGAIGGAVMSVGPGVASSITGTAAGGATNILGAATIGASENALAGIVGSAGTGVGQAVAGGVGLFSTNTLKVVEMVGKAGAAFMKGKAEQRMADQAREFQEKKLQTERDLAQQEIDLSKQRLDTETRFTDEAVARDEAKRVAHDQSVLSASQTIIGQTKVARPSEIKVARATIQGPTWHTGAGAVVSEPPPPPTTGPPQISPLQQTPTTAAPSMLEVA